MKTFNELLKESKITSEQLIKKSSTFKYAPRLGKNINVSNDLGITVQVSNNKIIIWKHDNGEKIAEYENNLNYNDFKDIVKKDLNISL